MTATTIELVPGVYQVIVDDAANTVVHQWRITGSWVTTLQENLNGLTQAVGGIKQPTSIGSLTTTYATSSTTYVAMGCSCAAFTPTDTSVELSGSMVVAHTTAAKTMGLALYRSTGAAPAQASAFGGSDTKVWEWLTTTATGQAGAGYNVTASFDFIDTVVVGTPYVYYICGLTNAASMSLIGTATNANASVFYVKNI
jgi:hypothetical protein